MTKLYIAKKYGQTPQNLLYDPKISFKAKGLFGYLQSKPDGWDFSADRIPNETADGRDSVQSGLRELEEHGYLRRFTTRNELGQWEKHYALFESPMPEEVDAEEVGLSSSEPTQGTPTADNPPQGNPASKQEVFSNKYVVKRRERKNASLEKENKNQDETPPEKKKEKSSAKKKESPLKYKNKLMYLLNVPLEDTNEFVEKFKVRPGQVDSKAEDLYNYCEAHGKKYKNYKAVLRNAIKKDFGERTEVNL